jgi:hypothetical protein
MLIHVNRRQRTIVAPTAASRGGLDRAFWKLRSRPENYGMRRSTGRLARVTADKADKYGEYPQDKKEHIANMEQMGYVVFN